MPDEALIDRYAAASGEVAGVLVGHTHFDHAVDAPAIARRHGANAYGSASLGHLMRLHGLGGLAVEVTPHQPYELGPFVVRFVPSRHSKLLFGRKVPMAGELTCDHLDGLAPGAYRWALRQLLLTARTAAGLRQARRPRRPARRGGGGGGRRAAGGAAAGRRAVAKPRGNFRVDFRVPHRGHRHHEPGDSAA
jgi:glyoxylase-like metal-dependent hydrolase (beta-lactamase superfamily II)